MKKNLESKLTSFIESLPVSCTLEGTDCCLLSLDGGIGDGSTNGKNCTNRGSCTSSTNKTVCHNTGDCSYSHNPLTCDAIDPTIQRPNSSCGGSNTLTC